MLTAVNAGALDPTEGPAWEARLAAIAAEVGPVDAACLGLSGHGESAATGARQVSVARELFGPATEVVNDVAIAFDGALGAGHGVLVLAGTGSMAWGRGPAGERRVGGWGDAFGDEGSAFWIGRRALARLACHIDGRRPDGDFAAALLAAMDLSPDDLSDWVYGSDPLDGRRARIASVARAVSRVAAAGDRTACHLLQAAGRELAAQGLTVARACGLAPPLRWSLAGGAMADPVLRAALTGGMGSAPQAPALPPVGGALVRAAGRAWFSGAVPSIWQARLRADLAGLNPDRMIA